MTEKDPAFPVKLPVMKVNEDKTLTQIGEHYNIGMSKLEFFSLKIFCAQVGFQPVYGEDKFRVLRSISIEQARLLLAEINERSEKSSNGEGKP